jgi:hypothetical protein
MEIQVSKGAVKQLARPQRSLGGHARKIQATSGTGESREGQSAENSAFPMQQATIHLQAITYVGTLKPPVTPRADASIFSLPRSAKLRPVVSFLPI